MTTGGDVSSSSACLRHRRRQADAFALDGGGGMVARRRIYEVVKGAKREDIDAAHLGPSPPRSSTAER
jgi:hypothetical protein